MPYAFVAAQARTHCVGTLVQMHEGVCKCRMEIITPKDSVGTLMELCQARRGDFIDMQFLTETRTTLIYELPLALVSPLQPSLPPPLPGPPSLYAHAPYNHTAKFLYLIGPR